MRLAFALLLIHSVLAAEPQDLAQLRSEVLALRKHAQEHRETRGATPDLTVVKHRLRDWVESRLTQFPADGDTIVLAAELHAGLRDTELFCNDDAECFPSSLGFLDEIQVNREREFLIISTAVGIWCGYDYSAYLYQWMGSRWQRRWDNEQNTYTPNGYLPQIIHAIHISRPDRDGDRLLVSLGSRPGCASAFQPVYFRLWRLPANRAPSRPSLDRSELVSVDGDPPIRGVLTADDLSIDFTKGGVGYGSSHKAIRHFTISGAVAKQTDPIAPTPRDFVEEWLSLPWEESAQRSESPALKEWHFKLHHTDDMGDFPDPPLRCASTPDLWQIATHLHETPKVYYLVRWREPLQFTMVGISDQAFPSCN
jgi:hypothetical protein